MTSHAQYATIKYVNACVAALGDELGRKLDTIEKKRDKRHESLKEDIRHQGDNIVELRADVVELKTDMAEVKATLSDHSEKLEQHTAILDRHTAILEDHGRKLDDHGQKLDQIIDLLRAS